MLKIYFKFVSHETFYFICKKIKMDIETLKVFIELISNSAFPICACVALFYILTKQQKELTKQIENNTKVLNELTTIIKMIKK